MTLTLEVAPVSFSQVEADWLPERMPYTYQWQTFELVQKAWEANATLCLFLVTPTGSGKTLASYAYSLKEGVPALGVYPTNELIRDQEQALGPEYERVLGRKDWVLRIDSKKLDDWGLDLSEPYHAQALETLLNWRYVVLTNPDILFYILFGRYPDIKGQRQRLFSLIGAIYRLIIFDEFHLYNIKQMADVAFIIAALQAINPNKGRIFIFASATPDLAIVPWLRDRLKLKVEIVAATPSTAAGARVIAQPVQLTVIPTDLQRWQGPQTLIENLPLVDNFLQVHPSARLVTILEAVAGAINIAQVFRGRYPSRTVGEVHGFSSDKERAEALRRSITVGTSTIEVGIDFKGKTEKDVLIFEAHTSGKFIQRFGRLARHGKSLPIPNWAIALVPEYVYHFLKERAPTDGRAVTRQELGQWIDEAYQRPEDFAVYLGKHAPVGFHAAKSFIEGLFQSDDSPQIKDGLANSIKVLTTKSAAEAAQRYRQYESEKIIAPLMTFRGANLQAAILDERGTDPGFPAKHYSLVFLLRRGVFEELTAEEYQDRLVKLAADWPDDVRREQKYAKLIERPSDRLLGVYGFFCLKGLRDEGRKVWFEIDSDEVWGRKGQVMVTEGLQIATDPPVQSRQLNKLLERKQIVSWFMDKHPSSIRLGRALPHLFELHELRLQQPGGAKTVGWSIAFNQDAFFLDSLNWYFDQRRDNAIIF